jgi:hypothetical protein
MTSQPLAVPAAAPALATELAALFTHDQELAHRLNDAQSRLRDANDQLCSGPHSDAHALLYDDSHVPSDSHVIAVMLDALRSGATERQLHTAALATLQEIRWAVHRAFLDYQFASEERRELAVEAGELGGRLVDALTAAGWTEPDARSANVHDLAEARGHHVPC